MESGPSSLATTHHERWNVTTDPEEYPARCDVSRTDLERIRERFLDDEDPFAERIDTGWPPEDSAGNVYPIWFEADDLTERGDLLDHNGNHYKAFSGNLEPIEREEWGACNAPLSYWRERYPNIRYCGRISNSYDEEYTYCPTHKGRDNVMKSAEEHIQTGLWTKTVDHLYEHVGPWKKLVGWGTFESLMGESAYEFGVEYRARTFDFSDEPVQPDDADDEGQLHARCGYPTQHADPALSLYVAAMMGVQMISVQPRVMFEDREAGEGMMESKTVEAAQLTAPPSEHDPSPQQFETLETWSEHHLNLPLSRLVTDRPKLLERGGVSTEAAEADDGVSQDDITLEIQADPEGIDTTEGGSDPNALGDDYTAESEKIAASAGDSSETQTETTEE